ncbi:MAG: C25 family cysteine peptidase [Bacillota bacterium]
MKRILLILLLTSVHICAQAAGVKENRIRLNIKSNKPLFRDQVIGNTVIRDYYEYADETREGEFILPSREVIIAIPPFSKPTIQVKNFSRHQFRGIIPKINIKDNQMRSDEEIIRPDSRALRNNSAELAEVKELFWFRDFYCMRIKINTYQYDISNNTLSEYDDIEIEVIPGNNYSIADPSPLKIRSQFDLEVKKLLFNSSIAEQFRSKNTEKSNTSLSSWFNTKDIYIKLGIGSDGIYRIYKKDLDRFGQETANVDPRTIKVLESGSEIPIYIQGENDGKFDQSDFIEFYGKKNYSKISARLINPSGSAYNNYMNKYSDTSIYFLTWGSSPGRRVSETGIFPDGIKDTLNYYTFAEHIEQNLTYQPASASTLKNQNPVWLETEAWYWNWLGAGSLNFGFNIKDLVANKNAAIYFKATSTGSSIEKNSHQLCLKYGGITIDSQSINKNDRLLLGRVFNSEILKNGYNSFTVTNYPNGTSPNVLLYDWYEIEYPRKLSAENDSISFGIRDSVASSLKIIKVDNVFADSLVIYRYMPSIKRIANFRSAGSSVYFADTAAAGSAYILIKSNRALTPLFLKRKQFTDIVSTVSQCDYIAITHPSLKTQVEEYMKYISSEYKLTAKYFLTDDIYDEYAYGYPEAESIKEFLQTAYNNWSYPKPSYLCLIGSANYDYKGYLKDPLRPLVNRNLVPSYGEPVSDAWFTAWNNFPLPQLYTGRIPANTPGEFQNYFQKLKSYDSQIFDSFNKSALFFSGGDGNDESQLQSLRIINEKIINETAAPRPLAFMYSHFYKTANPVSDFGPEDYKAVMNKISEGALFISYIGHSGTRTWDNSITEPYQLSNKKNKSFLVTDFGCSTAKFAEPDVACFGSLFLLSGQAIAYIGNSSLGFTSTASVAPVIFYESLMADSAYNLGRAHLDTKIRLFQQSGYNDYTRIFSLTSTLIGDPVINLAAARKPNLSIAGKDIELKNKYPTDLDDSLKVVLRLNNYGKSPSDTFTVQINDFYEGKVNFTKSIKRILPAICDTILISIPVNSKTGLHKLEITMDPDNRITEIYENDNKAELEVNVSSVSIKPYLFSDLCNAAGNSIKFIIPSVSLLKDHLRYIIQKDSVNTFSSNNSSYIEPDTIVAELKLDDIAIGKRIWLRTKLDLPGSEWNKEISFIKTGSSDQKITLRDKLSFSEQRLSDLAIINNSLQISTDTVNLKVKSGGGNVSKYGSINKNGINVLPNTFSWGMGIAVFDENTLRTDTARTFWYGDDPKEASNLAALINSIPAGRIVAMNVIDDGSSGLSMDLKNAIKTLGSTKVDSIGYRTPWVLIGKKGARPGEAIEVIKSNSYPFVLEAETNIIVNKSSGRMLTEKFGPSAGWKGINISQKASSDSMTAYLLIGSDFSGKSDTLTSIKLKSGFNDLSQIDPKRYPFLQLSSALRRGADQSSPEISSVDLSFTGAAELGIYHKALSISEDTVQVGETIKIKFNVFNIGEAQADSFKVKLEVLNPDNTRELVKEYNIGSTGAQKVQSLTADYNTYRGPGSRNFIITVDPDNKITELVKDNNFYSIPFYIKPDTSHPTVKISFDGKDIFDGEYVSSKPEIHTELYDDSFLPITDSSAMRLFLNDKPLYYSNNKELKVSYSATNPKVVVSYTPVLGDGEYKLKVIAKNATGSYADSAGTLRIFQVQNEIKLMNLYNYPNPFSNDTYFTFKATQLPDEVKIKIYTVAGRMVREISVASVELKYDFNKIYWDGRDQDGDILANGVYLYKIMVKKEGKTENYFQKVAIIR